VWTLSTPSLAGHTSECDSHGHALGSLPGALFSQIGQVMSSALPPHMNWCRPPPAIQNEPEEGTIQPTSAGRRPISRGLEPASPTHLNRLRGSQATAANLASEGRHHKLCTHINAKTPLTRGHACPRWDSNRTPGLAITGKSRKHRQSGPIRLQFDPIRSPGCAQCAHPFFSL
jgi:hypothetical protein